MTAKQLRPMKDVSAFLVRTDGVREPFAWQGEHTHVRPTRQADGSTTQTTFSVGDGGIAPDGTLLFHEVETIDVSERMAEAAVRNRERTMDYMRKGWKYDEDMAEKDAEIERLRALLT